MQPTASERIQPKAEPYFLISFRAGLRTWGADDLPLALQLWGDPAVAKFLDARLHLTECHVKEKLGKEITNLQIHGVQYWPAFLFDGGVFIGCCGLKPKQPEERLFELGFHLCQRFWGHGLAVELAETVIAYAFQKLQLPALFAGHHPDNLRSRRVLEKLGFRYTHDEFYAPTGVTEPCYRLTRPGPVAATQG